MTALGRIGAIDLLCSTGRLRSTKDKRHSFLYS